MASAMRVFKKFRASDGRIKAVTASGVLALVAVIAMLVGVLPVMAEHDTEDPNAHPLVAPVQVDWGGGDGACKDDLISLEGNDKGEARGPSAAEYEAHLNNPKPGTHEITDDDDPNNTKITITIDEEDDKVFDFSIEAGTGMAAYDVVVNGGQKSNHYEYDGSGITPSEDFDLFAPTKENKDELHNLSHINICYDDELFSVSGTKYHDRDTDGIQDATDEDGLAGWTISAFPVLVDEETGDTTVEFGAGVSTTTGNDGSYSLSLVAGDYVVCEAAPDQEDLETGDPSELPADGFGFTWSWGQSEPSGDNADVCADSGDHKPLGYAITVSGDITGLDFGNHRQVTVTCDPLEEQDVVIPLGGDGTSDDPKSTVTFPAGCQTDDLTVAYEVGRSDPDTESGEPGEDDWTQFVVFGGNPAGSSTIQQTIVWDIEEADYNADGTLLTLPSTLVQLDPGGEEKPAVLCNTLADNMPNEDNPHCLHTRVMDEGGDLPVGTIQITEDYLFLGDPFSFR